MVTTMNSELVLRISQKTSLPVKGVMAVCQLLAEGGTVPFIARYRKEATDSLDEVAITAIRDTQQEILQLDARREAIIKSLEEQKVLTPDLKKRVLEAETMTKLEDVYLPYRPKRRTRAMIAKEKGLEPLADMLWNYEVTNLEESAEAFVNAEKEVKTVQDALQGAYDIVAERINDHETARDALRKIFKQEAVLRSKVIVGKEEEGAKFRDYFAWEEPVKDIPSHRLLAIRRGEKEGFLFYRMLPDEATCHGALEKIFLRSGHALSSHMQTCIYDAYKRLLMPSMETELRLETKKKADAAAIHVFSDNLQELLMAPALGQKRVLAIDPGFRTGCKVVVLDEQGKLLHHDVIYLIKSAHELKDAEHKILAYCQRFSIQAIAIGNGTASRETETFVRGLQLPSSITIVVVNESGASIYSASDVAREEFPNEDVTVRGSVSIGRRLMDPLAELVKLDPKSIGVGQYQHDVDQRNLQQALDDVVISCVNKVGVEVNTASKQLLSYVSGLNTRIADEIVKYRNEHGPFSSREELKKVPQLGAKAFEQAAGFLRIRDGKHPLDSSAVHPERYTLVEQMTADLQCTLEDILSNRAMINRVEVQRYVSDEVGLPTLKDILAELDKPGRDPREKFEAFAFQEGVETMEDLKVGMKLPGLVTNVTAFGAFVDIGVHQDGLVHISQLADKFVANPAEVVKVQQPVQVTVTELDIPRRRIALSMRTNPEIGDQRKPREQSDRRPNTPKDRSGQNRSSSSSRKTFGNSFNDAFANL